MTFSDTLDAPAPAVQTGTDHPILTERPDSEAGLHAAIRRYFHAHPDALRLWVPLDLVTALGVGADAGLIHGEAAHPDNGSPHAWVDRRGFHQWSGSALTAARPIFPEILTPAGHPLRPRQPVGRVYERFDPQVQAVMSLRVIDRHADLELFHDWMNQGRVAFFWELAKPKEELFDYLTKLEDDPHAYGLIGEIDGVPSAYFEAYWAMEDRLGPHYDADPYDHGWHALIGNAAHLGRVRTLAWFRTITHYLFLEDPRTRRVVGEPRASHVKMLRYAADCAFDKVKEFDFPHKRAALMVCERRRFFTEVGL